MRGYLKELVANYNCRAFKGKAKRIFEGSTKTGTYVLLVVMYRPRYRNFSNAIKNSTFTSVAKNNF